MASSDKVVQAYKYAKRVGLIDKLKFDRNNDNVTIGDIVVIETDSNQEANDVKDALNTALDSVKNQLITDLEAKIDNIWNN